MQRAVAPFLKVRIRRLSLAELMRMGQTEFRVIADTREEVARLLAFLKHNFPRSVASQIKLNDSRPGFRAYLTVFDAVTLEDYSEES